MSPERDTAPRDGFGVCSRIPGPHLFPGITARRAQARTPNRRAAGGMRPPGAPSARVTGADGRVERPRAASPARPRRRRGARRGHPPTSVSASLGPPARRPRGARGSGRADPAPPGREGPRRSFRRGRETAPNGARPVVRPGCAANEPPSGPPPGAGPADGATARRRQRSRERWRRVLAASKGSRVSTIPAPSAGVGGHVRGGPPRPALRPRDPSRAAATRGRAPRARGSSRGAPRSRSRRRGGCARTRRRCGWG